ncbi:MAG: hypothetical protein NXI10_15885 [bacterium]|nr:hypothetical protein [bacterium]
MKLLAAYFLLISSASFGQDTIVAPQAIFFSKEVKPSMWSCCCSREASFPGGEKEFHRYLQSELNFTGIQGFNEKSPSKIYVTFFVDEFGRNQRIKTHFTDNVGVINEIERVFSQMPEWIPAEQGGKIIGTRVSIPINVVWEDPITASN